MDNKANSSRSESINNDDILSILDFSIDLHYNSNGSLNFQFSTELLAVYITALS